MKLVIQIPCFNEAENLPQVLAELPTRVAGFDEVAVVVIDDGSTDDTALIAWQYGVDRLVRHSCNRGLAAAFSSGLDAALQLNADVIINLDADGQYPASEIPNLVAPLLVGKADMVIGDRQPGRNFQFSFSKRSLQRLGSWVVSRWVGYTIPDAVSGFRAFTRETAARLIVTTSFSYTLETIFQVRQFGLSLHSVPIQTRHTQRPSRLCKNIPKFVARSTMTILKLQVMYRPLAFLLPIAAILVLVGVAPIVRFLWLVLIGHSDGHVQSLVLGGVVFLSGLLVSAMAILAECQCLQRRLLERTLHHLRRELSEHQLKVYDVR